MKLVVGTFTLLFFIIACSSTQDKIESQQTDYKLEINNLLDKWHKDAADTNIEDYFSLMHEDFVFIGTDGTENWDKELFRKFCEPYFEQGRAWDFKSLERNIYISDDSKTVWFDEVLDSQLGPCRGSGIFENIDGEWKLHQYVLSMLVDNNDIAGVLEMKRENDSLFLSQFR
jgi:hypothetical protein